jgi:hypothetical protein
VAAVEAQAALELLLVERLLEMEAQDKQAHHSHRGLV